MYILAPHLHVFVHSALLIFHCLVRFNPKVAQRNIVQQKPADPESKEAPKVIAIYDTAGTLATSGSQEGPDAVPLAMNPRRTATPAEVSWRFF